ncbi:MAG: phosphate ABC transporter ATP-binding protein [Clostridia bacterium]|nr:phosphate ABC transporter ATP-binding protein [Clostridia bacterium]
MTAIRIKNLNISFGDKNPVRVIKNISLDIPENQLTTIIGPSGCGKTTLLKAINRLHDIHDNCKIEGQIFIGDEDIYHPKRPVNELRRKIGLIAQRPYVLPSSIYNNIAFGPKLHGKKKKNGLDEIVENCLTRTHLWDEVKDRLKAPAVDLSIGQQQRLCIARALAVEPEVILCDEVTSALDPISSEKIEALLLSLKDSYTIVMVSHILRQARRMSDNVVFMYFGELIETGEAKAFFTSPADERTKNYISGTIAG